MYKVPRCLSTKLEAGYTGWKGHVSHRSVQSCRDKNLQRCALQRPQVVRDTMAMSSRGQMSLQELASCETFWKCSTTEPVLCDFSQLDNLQTAVFQFEIVVTFEEVAVICGRQAQCTLCLKYLLKLYSNGNGKIIKLL